MRKKRMTSLLLAVLMVMQLFGAAIPHAAAQGYQLQNGDVVFIPGVAKAGEEIEAWIVNSSTAAAGEKVTLRMPEHTDDDKFKASSSDGRFWEMFNCTLMRVSGIWYGKGEANKGRRFRFGYHETITELTDTTLHIAHDKLHKGGGKCGVGFADACGNTSNSVRYFECAGKLSIAKDLTIIDLTGNGATTLAQVKELTDAGKAVINLYVPDGAGQTGHYEEHQTGKVSGTAQVIIVQDAMAEGYALPEDGDVYYISGAVTGTQSFVSARVVQSKHYKPGEQIKVFIPKGTTVEGGFDKSGAPANTTACFWQGSDGIVKVLTADTGRHDVLTLQEGKATLTAADGHGESCVLGYAGGCGGKLTTPLSVENPVILDLRSNATEKVTTLEQAAQITAEGAAVVNTYAPNGKLTALAVVDRTRSFALTVKQSERGTISTDKTSGAVGETVTVTATPEEGCELRYVMVDGNAILGNTFTTTAAKHTVSAVFRQKDRFADDVTKILIIGNSHGVDSTNYLYDVAKDQGVNLVIGDLYNGGCTLSEHLGYINKNAAEYNYYKTEDGTWTTKTDSNLLTGLLDEDWDIIVLQELSWIVKSSKKEDLDRLIAFVNDHKTNPDAQLAWFTAWRVHNTCVRPVLFDDYNGEVYAMGDGIRQFAKEKIGSRGDFTWVIPTGTAVDNASTGFVGDGLFRDDVHMNGVGRVLSACTWYTTLFGEPIEKLGLTRIRDSYDCATGGVPHTMATDLSEEMRQFIVKASNAACANPYEVTSMATYELQEGDVVYIPGRILEKMGCTAYIVRSATQNPGAKVSVVVPAGTAVQPDRFWKMSGGVLTAVSDSRQLPADPVLVDLRACVMTGIEPAAAQAVAVEGQSTLKCYDSVVFLEDASVQMSRGETVQLLYTKLGQPVDGQVRFPDMSADHKYAAAVSWAAGQGVVSGYGDGRFGAEDNVTIEQAAVMLWNHAGKPASDGSAARAGTHSGWATDAMRWCVEKGILEGLPNEHNFPYQDPNTVANRGQVAQMLKNYLDK